MSALEDERDFLLRSLRDLEDEHAAGDLADADYAALKDEYTAKAAAVLRRLDGAAPLPVEGRAPKPRNRKRGKIVAGVLALAAVSGGAGYAVAQSSGERLAGEQVTGELPEGSVDRITKAQLLVRDRKILEAIKVYDDLLEDDPENPVALAERGWLLVQVGEPSLIDKGLAGIDRAIAAEPTYADAHFFRGMTLWRAKGDPVQAVAAFQRGIDAKPAPALLSTLQEVKGLAEADATAAASSATP